MWLIVTFLPVAVLTPSALAPKTCENSFLQLFIFRLCDSAFSLPVPTLPMWPFYLSCLPFPGEHRLWIIYLKFLGSCGAVVSEHTACCSFPRQKNQKAVSPYSVHFGVADSFGLILWRNTQGTKEMKYGAEAVERRLHFSNSLAKDYSQIVSFMTLREAGYGWWHMPETLALRTGRQENWVQGQPLLQSEFEV